MLSSQSKQQDDDFYSRFRQPRPLQPGPGKQRTLLNDITVKQAAVKQSRPADKNTESYSYSHPLASISPIHMQLMQRPLVTQQIVRKPRQPDLAERFSHAVQLVPQESKRQMLHRPREESFKASYQNNLTADESFNQVFSEQPQKAKSSGFRFRLSTQKIGYTIAVLVLLVGGYITFDSARSNRMVVAQAKQLEQVNTSNTTNDGEPSAPTDDGQSRDETPVSDQAVAAYSVPASMPKYLIIDDLGIKARVKSEGRDRDGAVGVPNNVFDVGWYDESSTPGSAGAAFFDGHVAGYTSHGALYNLKNAEEGTEIRVVMGDNSEIRYRVVTKDYFPQGDVDMVKALSPIRQDKFGLNIMTCSGSFDPKSDSYAERLVVYAAAE